MNTAIRFIGDLRVINEQFVVYRGPDECKEPEDLEYLRQFGPHYISRVDALMPDGHIAKVQMVHTMNEVWIRCGSDVVPQRVLLWTKELRKEFDRLMLLNREDRMILQ